jgi:recombination associated protein RdgC
MLKSAILYSITVSGDLMDLEDQLAENSFKPCNKQALLSRGWLEPAGHGSGYMRNVMGGRLICLGIEEKKIPGPLVKRLLAEQVDKYIQSHGSKPNNETRKELKSEIEMSLISNLPPKFSVVNILILEHHNLLIVEASSHSKAEAALDVLRDAINLKPIPYTPKNSFSLLSTTWVQEQKTPDGFGLTGSMTLNGISKETTTLKYHSLPSTEIARHIEAGEKVVKLGMYVEDELEFTLDTKLAVSSIKYHPSVKEEVRSGLDDKGDEVARLEATLALTIPMLTKVAEMVNAQFVE